MRIIKCRRCGETKPETEFYTTSVFSNTRETTCMECRKASARRRKQREAEFAAKREEDK